MMNENKKEALKIFLEYILQENENNTEINSIIEKHINEKLKDYFDVVGTKIDEIDNKTNQLKKDFQEEITINNKILVQLDEIKKSVNIKSITGDSSEVKQSTNKSKKKRHTSNVHDEKVLSCIPEMTNAEAAEYIKDFIHVIGYGNVILV